jgi:hypothetical protein
VVYIGVRGTYWLRKFPNPSSLGLWASLAKPHHLMGMVQRPRMQGKLRFTSTTYGVLSGIVGPHP